MRYRDWLLTTVRDWFRANRFIDFSAPILTALPLYDESTTLSTVVNGAQVFLTQCIGFYLEAAVHALDRIYNIGPSFRGEESRSKRHLMEYWHIMMRWLLDIPHVRDAIPFPRTFRRRVYP